MKNCQIPVADITLQAMIRIPAKAKGMIIFANVSEKGRASHRINLVAEILYKNGFASLMAGLLTDEEWRQSRKRLDIELLIERLVEVTAWMMMQPEWGQLPLGYFGAGTGSAAALEASSVLGQKIAALVSFGGRTDLAAVALPAVVAPVLLIAGSLDKTAVSLNYKTFDQLKSNKEMVIVEGAADLLEEPGKVEEVAKLATGWFERYLTAHVAAIKKSA